MFNANDYLLTEERRSRMMRQAESMRRGQENRQTKNSMGPVFRLRFMAASMRGIKQGHGQIAPQPINRRALV